MKMYKTGTDPNDVDWMTVANFITTMSYVDTDVEYGYTYEYAVRARNSGNLWGRWSYVTEPLSEPDKPLRPISPVAKHEVDEQGSFIALNWDAPDDSQTQLWRSVRDIGADNKSLSLSYRIERRIGDGAWKPLEAMQAHQYIPGETPQSAITHFHKQKLIDRDSEAVMATGNLIYRVSALVDLCNQSEWISVDEVSGTPVTPVLTLGTITNLALSSSLELTWTPAMNAASQVVIVVNAADDTDFCLGSLSGTASSYTCSTADAATGSNYVGLVIALDGQGGSTVSNFPVQTVQ